MMAVLIIYLLYLWVLVIHGFFGGISAYAVFRKKYYDYSYWVRVIWLIIPLGLLEIYWIPIADYLDVFIGMSNSSANEFYEITKDTNIAKTLRPAWYHPILWTLQAIWGEWIGRKLYLQIKNEKDVTE